MGKARTSRLTIAGVALAALFSALPAGAQCNPEPPLQNFTGAGQIVCTCFEPGEEAGSIFNLPAGDFPIEILSVGIGWGSAAGSQPDSLEQAFHIYRGTVPNPGAPIFTQEGPVLTDGAINVFDIEFLPGEVIVTSGPFMVTLEFANQNAGGGAFTPSVVHDGNGCQIGRNSVYAPGLGGWWDACQLGVSGDWVFVVRYRKVSCASTGPGAVPDGDTVPGDPLRIGKEVGGLLPLAWGASCSPTDTTYSVYEGTLGGSFDDHLPKNCNTGGTTANILPGSGNHYYVVVPRDDSNEGSYGLDSAGNQRPPAAATCRPPAATFACP
jgi:hypothetical protein